MDEPETSASHRSGKTDDMLLKVSELERSRGKEKHMNFFVSTKSLHFSRRVRAHNLVLTNVEPFPLTYTIRTTHPKLFRAYPSKGVIPKESQTKLAVRVNSIDPNDFENVKAQIACTVRDGRGYEMKKLIKCRLELSEDTGETTLPPKKYLGDQDVQGEEQEIIASLLDAVRAKGEHVLRSLPSRKNIHTYALAIFPLVFGLLLSAWIAASRSTPASFMQNISKGGGDVLLSYAIGTLCAWATIFLWAK
eukprot:TRINITY_DN43552_c0_g1_i1.p1 TRINITY_DN43552_c0_g1~~TRINITY_DN43552_c0_g1_i1.p1  ORF type:complete len:249 (+),score=53.73 TRINITY_DN43552_c0_g1_i1:101-847(+)